MSYRLASPALALLLAACSGGDTTSSTESSTSTSSSTSTGSTSSTTAGESGSSSASGSSTSSGSSSSTSSTSSTSSSTSSGSSSTGGVEPSGSLVSIGDECLELQEPQIVQECVDYSYDGVGALTLKHHNAAFNCCPEGVDAEFVITEDAVMVTTTEAEGACDCLCLFDLEYAVVDLAPGTYTISVDGLYVPDGDPPLSAEVDLVAEPEGTICADRSDYPWFLP